MLIFVQVQQLFWLILRPALLIILSFWKNISKEQQREFRNSNAKIN